MGFGPIVPAVSEWERERGIERGSGTLPSVVRSVRRGRGVRDLLARGLWVSAELVVTLGLVLLLLVVHQLWWTNREARQDAGRTVHALQREWDLPPPDGPAGPSGEPVMPEPLPSAAGPTGTRNPPAPARTTSPRWDQAYAVLRIPRIGLTAPVAEGTSKGGVLDRGYVGHYSRTAQAGQAGNFSLAGHRNTHGEPFRRIDRLRRGDRITVETRDAVYTYTVDKSLAQTAPSDSGVIAPVPRSNITTSAGYSEPGYYLTLTTCTPEFSSRYRLVVWGKLTSMRPR
ncbi:class E sortase [Streptomyces sp. CA-256286]|uniref:Class E sortase n=1 Tax=Streptomyces microflavus TaxID=1919 RepID=A0A6N9V6B2_STRMI|nr:class E sortase [Streptomyces sp. 09ZI22]NEB66609.1 class E sortase [Streptomyces microflavus]QTA32238.1 class E sortase [Streptomyces sp. CA-256286]